MSAISELVEAVSTQRRKRLELQATRPRRQFKTPWDAFTAPDAHPLLKLLRFAVDARMEVNPP